MAEKTIPLWEYLRLEGEKILQEYGPEAFEGLPNDPDDRPCIAFVASSVGHAALVKREDGKWWVEVFFSSSAVSAGAPHCVTPYPNYLSDSKEEAIESGARLAAALLANELPDFSQGAIH
jgi:hypothetical protein